MLFGPLYAILLFVLHVPETLHRAPAHQFLNLCGNSNAK
jgi:hypothetical protein